MQFISSEFPSWFFPSRFCKGMGGLAPRGGTGVAEQTQLLSNPVQMLESIPKVRRDANQRIPPARRRSLRRERPPEQCSQGRCTWEVRIYTQRSTPPLRTVSVYTHTYCPGNDGSRHFNSCLHLPHFLKRRENSQNCKQGLTTE